MLAWYSPSVRSGEDSVKVTNDPEKIGAARLVAATQQFAYYFRIPSDGRNDRTVAAADIFRSRPQKSPALNPQSARSRSFDVDPHSPYRRCVTLNRETSAEARKATDSALEKFRTAILNHSHMQHVGILVNGISR